MKVVIIKSIIKPHHVLILDNIKHITFGLYDIVVYDGEEKQYITFTTEEAAKEAQDVVMAVLTTSISFREFVEQDYRGEKDYEG